MTRALLAIIAALVLAGCGGSSGNAAAARVCRQFRAQAQHTAKLLIAANDSYATGKRDAERAGADLLKAKLFSRDSKHKYSIQGCVYR